jgi:hypothetical protein
VVSDTVGSTPAGRPSANAAPAIPQLPKATNPSMHNTLRRRAPVTFISSLSELKRAIRFQTRSLVYSLLNLARGVNALLCAKDCVDAFLL